MSIHMEVKSSLSSPPNPYPCHCDYYYCAETSLARVPFQWEAEPGRSKQHAYGEFDVNIYPLRPPPILLSKKHAESAGWPLRPTMSAHSSISSSVKEFFSSLVLPRRRSRRQQQAVVDVPYKPLGKCTSSSPNNAEERGGFGNFDDDDDDTDGEVGGGGNDSQVSKDDFFSLRSRSPAPPPPPRKQFEYQHKDHYQTRDYRQARDCQPSEYRQNEHHQREYHQSDKYHQSDYRRSDCHQNGTLQEMLEAEWESTTDHQRQRPIAEMGFWASGAATMDRDRDWNQNRNGNGNRNRYVKPDELDEEIMRFRLLAAAPKDRDRFRVRDGTGNGTRGLAAKEKVSGRAKNVKMEEPIRPRHHRKSFTSRIFAICGAP